MPSLLMRLVDRQRRLTDVAADRRRCGLPPRPAVVS